MIKPDSHYSDLATERCAEQDKQREEVVKEAFEQSCRAVGEMQDLPSFFEGYKAAQAAMRLEWDAELFKQNNTLKHRNFKLEAESAAIFDHCNMCSTSRMATGTRLAHCKVCGG